MAPDPKRPDVLLSVASEVEATAVATALADYDVQAMTLGGYVSGFKAEAPGNVAVVVKRVDFDRAQRALAEIRRQQAELDWSKVDVMEFAEEPAVAVQDHGAPLAPADISRLFWIAEFLGLALCFVVWLFTRQLTPPLVYVAAGLVVVGLLGALFPLTTRR